MRPESAKLLPEKMEYPRRECNKRVETKLNEAEVTWSKWYSREIFSREHSIVKLLQKANSGDETILNTTGISMRVSKLDWKEGGCCWCCWCSVLFSEVLKGCLTHEQPVCYRSYRDGTVECILFVSQDWGRDESSVRRTPNGSSLGIYEGKVTLEVRQDFQVVFDFNGTQSMPRFMQNFVSIVSTASNIYSSVNEVTTRSEVWSPVYVDLGGHRLFSRTWRSDETIAKSKEKSIKDYRKFLWDRNS